MTNINIIKARIRAKSRMLQSKLKQEARRQARLIELRLKARVRR